jgi:hypothetical protein
MLGTTLCATAFEHFYCPTGSIWPGNCEIGYFVGSGQDTCEACPQGEYCWPDENNSYNAKRGACDASDGYLCRSAAFSPRPLVDGLAFIQAGSNRFSTYNGPVTSGWIATGNIPIDVTACPVGTWQPSILCDACIDCYDGRYCPNTGMGNIDEYLVAAGYYSLKGCTVEEPGSTANGASTYGTNIDPALAGEVNGGPCPLEHECRFTMVHMMKCEDGFISEETGLAQCASCPADHYCDMEENSAAPILCITQSICN